MVAIKSHFDGKVIVPDEPVNLPSNQQVILHVQTTGASESTPDQSTGDFFGVMQSLVGSVEAPGDWAAEHDHYLYGTPKRVDQGEK